MTAQLLGFGNLCAACGHLDATFQFCALTCSVDEDGHILDHTSMGDPPNPHLHRTCTRCGYQWLERCLALAPSKGSDA